MITLPLPFFPELWLSPMARAQQARGGRDRNTMRTFTAMATAALFLGAAPALAREAPSEAYQWAAAPFGGGGFIPGFVFHPREKGLLYARTDVGGCYRWDAAAGAWIALNDGLGRDDN